MPRTGNRELMRELNTKLVLNLIRESESISQIDIFNQTRLSVGTVASIVKELKKNRLVKISGQGESSYGRKPIMLRFNPEARLVLSANIFADETGLAILDLAGGIKHQTVFPTLTQNGPEAMLGHFTAKTLEFVESHRLEKEKILGLGISCEGMVDPRTGTLSYSARLGWRNVPIKGAVERGTGLQTFVDSDGAAMVLGEFHYGRGRGTQNLVCVDIDFGIGSIWIMNGTIYRGSHLMAGEMGHSPVIPGGPECPCGKRGCLETLASGAAILARIRQAVAQGTDTQVPREAIASSSTRTALRAVFEAARQGDALANQVVREAGYYLGVAVSAIINFVDPELILLTGGVTDAGGNLLLSLIREAARDHVVDATCRPLRIEAGTLGEKAAVIGAAAFVYEHEFKRPIVKV